jgi:arsenical pump membrane protein
MWLSAAVLGSLTVVTGLLPLDDATGVLRRIAPVLVFLVAMTVLAELADAAELFDVAAVRAARLAGGRTWRLYAAVLLLAVVTTVGLSLDTTAVLLTPVMLSLAQRLELDPLPFAFAAVWLANTASMLLPVSNLTNLLAVGSVDLSPAAYAGRMLLPAVVAIALTCVALALWHRRALAGSYTVPARHAAADRPLVLGAAVACLLLVPALLLGIPVAVASSVSAALLAAVFVVRRPSALRSGLVPWRLVLLVIGLFLVVAAAGPHGLDAGLRDAAGSDSRLRLVATAAVGANVANNLPVYLALDRVVPADRLLDVLLGVNLGPLVLPWGSLATLLWLERCRARGVHIRLRTFALSGLLLTPPLLVASTVALHL